MHRPLPKPVNLQVLPKNMPPEDVIKVMHGFEGALGVKCEFCHMRNAQTHHLDFASDAKEDKQIARIMLKMTHDINENFMSQVKDPDAMPEDKHVMCGTCHRGHKMPEHFIPPKQDDNHVQHGDGMPAMK
ncbi:c-type cytochrome [Paracidobacterium acidisoli]|nr:c-type cytochrome [Paracidobacterium acidisoli]MBT9331716.1 c-type cytochrome [Paracidobacterium acidisoli]